MKLHSIKKKGSKSELTGGCSLNGQIKWWIKKYKKGLWQMKKGLWQMKESFVHESSS